jgi:hypothetical protein
MPGRCKVHSLMQRGSRWRTDHGDAHLKTPDTQEGELLSQEPTLFFGGLTLLVGHNCFSRQARNLLLSRILFPERSHKLAP